MLIICFHFCLFPVCFFWLSIVSGNTDNQHFTIRKQILKKKNVMPITGRSPMSRCWRVQPSIASYTSGGIAVVCSLLRLEFFYKFIVILIFLAHILVGLKCLLYVCSVGVMTTETSPRSWETSADLFLKVGCCIFIKFILHDKEYGIPCVVFVT